MKKLLLTISILLITATAYATPKYMIYIHVPTPIPSTLQTYVSAERPSVWSREIVYADSYKSVSGYYVFYLGEKETARWDRAYVVGFREIVEAITPPACVPEWCDAPLVNCTDTPITGTDSCGNPCSKPSAEWPNCIKDF